MNICGGLTNKLLQQLIADRNIKCLLRCSNRYSSVYDAKPFSLITFNPLSLIVLVNKLSDDSQKKEDAKFLRNQHSFFGLAAPLLAFALGAWQLQRLQWKTNLLQKIDDRMKQEVVPFPDDNLSLLDDLEYGKVQVTGEFLHDHEFYIQPRQRFDKDESKSKSRPSVNNFGSSGAQVITPNIILVNRGWVPPQRITPESRPQGQVQGQVTFNAVVRHTEKRPSFIRRNDPDKGLWFYTDIEQMAKKHGTLPVLVDACYESSIEGGPIGGQTRVTYRNDHMMYACFWIIFFQCEIIKKKPSKEK
ncbi:SURF1 family protein [Onchocerca flexuosa]|uniref:SURF1-like protein n=1 Tax=Onchocerca flexuosa TaxID=387005 RepID=A0A238BUB8_9BILA|nr:SURF1 family protein [Onchocerca flexuosa]